MQHLKITICENAAEAISKGYIYSSAEHRNTKSVELVEAVVVRNGTVEGRPTVDLILQDGDGNRYVTMVTGRLLKCIPCGDRDAGN